MIPDFLPKFPTRFPPLPPVNARENAHGAPWSALTARMSPSHRRSADRDRSPLVWWNALGPAPLGRRPSDALATEELHFTMGGSTQSIKGAIRPPPHVSLQEDPSAGARIGHPPHRGTRSVSWSSCDGETWGGVPRLLMRTPRRSPLLTAPLRDLNLRLGDDCTSPKSCLSKMRYAHSRGDLPLASRSIQ
jgi:hypothetical protein